VAQPVDVTVFNDTVTRGNDAPDRVEAELAMLRLVADGAATRTPVGDDALWTLA